MELLPPLVASPLMSVVTEEHMRINSNTEELNEKNRLTLGVNTAKNTNYMKKKVEAKVVENSISYKKVSGRPCVSPPSPRVELRSSKDCHV